MLEAARRELDRMRESPESWPELRDDIRRATVLWALQYDRRPTDLELARFLAEQEARCRAEADFQGLSDEAELAGFLLAEFRQVEDVWRQWAIKRANFDTWCGYDLHHLSAAGVQKTIDFVRESDHPERGDLLERLLDENDRPWVSEDDLATWFQHRRAHFPSDPAAEPPLTWFDRAMLAGDRALAREWLDRWADGRPRDKDTLSSLRHRLADLEAYSEAAAVQRDLLPFAGTPWDRASAWRDLGKLERLAGDPPAAWTALRECRRHLADVPGWTEVGLGRMYVEELFQLASTADAGLSATVFAEADRQARDVPRLPLVTLQCAAEAAARAGDEARADHYRTLSEAERRRIGLD